MNALVRAIQAETLKTKRTLALAMTILAPLVIAILQFAQYTYHAEYYVVRAGENPWMRFCQTMLVYWAIFMLSFYIALETALLSALDHGPRSWKMLYTLPVPRTTLYAAKQIVGMGLIALSVGVLVLLMFPLAGLLKLLMPTVFMFNAPFPWEHVLKYAFLSFVASWLMISLHVWVSLRWKSFVVALGVGITATIVAVFALGRDAAMFYPWTMPGLLMTRMMDDSVQAAVIAMNVLGAIPIAVLGARDIARRDVL